MARVPDVDAVSELNPQDPAYVASGSSAADGPAGTGLVVWSESASNLFRRIAARRVDGAGRPIGPIQTVATALGETAVARDASSGGYLAAWSYEGEVSAQRLDANGAPIGALLSLSPPVEQTTVTAPAVASDGRRGFLVVWARGAGGLINDGRVYARAISRAGKPGLPRRLSRANTVARSYGPRVAYDPKRGRYVAAWVADGQPDVVTARSIDTTGAPAGAERAVGTAPRGRPDYLSLGRLGLAADGRGGVLVAWVQAPGRVLLVARRVNGAAVPRGKARGLVALEPGGWYYGADVAYVPRRERFVVATTYNPREDFGHCTSSDDTWFAEAARSGAPVDSFPSLSTMPGPYAQGDSGEPCPVFRIGSPSLYAGAKPVGVLTWSGAAAGNPSQVWASPVR